MLRNRCRAAKSLKISDLNRPKPHVLHPDESSNLGSQKLLADNSHTDQGMVWVSTELN